MPNTRAILLHEYARHCYNYARMCGDETPCFVDENILFCRRVQLRAMESLLRAVGLTTVFTIRYHALRMARRDDNTVPLVL